MRKMRALEHGYFGGRVIEPGELVIWPHPNTPAWLVEISGTASVAPARDPLDHDGDGRKGGSLPKSARKPGGFDAMSVKELVAFAAEHGIDITSARRKPEIVAVIEAAVKPAEAGPFGDAPTPVSIEGKPAGTGLQEAMGGIQPDWVRPDEDI